MGHINQVMVFAYLSYAWNSGLVFLLKFLSNIHCANGQVPTYSWVVGQLKWTLSDNVAGHDLVVPLHLQLLAFLMTISRPEDIGPPTLIVHIHRNTLSCCKCCCMVTQHSMVRFNFHTSTLIAEPPHILSTPPNPPQPPFQYGLQSVFLQWTCLGGALVPIPAVLALHTCH